MPDFKGKVAIVTGAASGIGRATALLLARSGAHVVINDLFADGAAKVEDEITALGGTAESVAGDVTETGFIDRLFDGAAARHGHLDIVHNNVGFGGRSTIVDLSDEEWERGIAGNLTATFRGTRAALRIMRDQGTGGAIVNTASMSGYAKVVGVTPYYGSAKAAVVHLTREAAIEGGAYGVRVNAVLPGSVRTPAFEKYIGPDAAMQAYLSEIPLRRIAEPDDVARLVAFLASDDAAVITGVGVPIDGGWSAMLAQPTDHGGR